MRTLGTLLASALVCAAAAPTAPVAWAHDESAPSKITGREVTVKQEPGMVVYWVLPGPRRLSESVFGVPGHPLHVPEQAIRHAEGPVKELFKKFPIMAGVPVKARETNPEETEFTRTKVPTPVSDKGMIVSGHFEVTYIDRQPYDVPDQSGETLDDVKLEVGFTDPRGNEYELQVTRLYQPPFPGFESGGGVITDAWLHGNTGTDSPLFPKTFGYGAFWGVGDVIVNGKVADRDKWIHFMTTQIVRDQDYRLAVDEELPLKPEKTIAGQPHHTHVIVRPIKITPEGPEFDPVKTAFALPNGKNQPFIHVMFEQDTLVKDDFKGWNEARRRQKAQSTEQTEGAFRVVGTEFSLAPGKVTVTTGEPVKIRFENAGKIAHNLTIGGLGIKTPTIQAGESATVTFTPETTGTFDFWCNVPGHREAGMKGTLVAAP